MKSKFCRYIALFPFACLFGASAAAQTLDSKSDGYEIYENFQSGWHEATASLGVLFPNITRRKDRPDSRYVLGTVGLGYMVNAPGSGGIFRGSLELMPQLFGAEIYGGPGNYIAGAALLARYNFVPKDWRWVPYAQFGGGVTALDIPHNYDGKSFNFNIDLGAGIHYFIRPKCSLNAEYVYQHISNANLWRKNVGVNSSGPMFGISLFF